MLKIITKNVGNHEEKLTLDTIARKGAQEMPAQALEAEVREYLALHCGEVDEHGHRLVVCNGTARPRQVAFGVGKIEITAPRVQ